MATRVLTILALLALPMIGPAQQGAFPIPADIPADIRTQIEALRSPDPSARRDALNALALLKEQAAPAAPYIADLLGDKAYPRPNYIGSGVTNPIGRMAAFTLAAIGKPAVAPTAAVLKGGT